MKQFLNTKQLIFIGLIMAKRIVVHTLLLLVAFLVLSGSNTIPLIQVQYPVKNKIVYSTPRHYFVGDVDTFQVKRLELTRAAEKSDQMYSEPGTVQSEFVKLVSNLFSRDFQITNFELTVHPAKQTDKDVKFTAAFPAKSRVDRNTFWHSKEFQDIYEKVMKDTSFRALDIHMKGSVASNIEISKRKFNDRLGSFFVMRMELAPGVNDYSLRALDEKDRVLEEHLYSFLYKSDVDDQTEAPTEYGKSKFHTADNEKSCATCHRMRPSSEELKSNTATVRSCYPCHVWVTASINVHPPVSDWNCFYCHSAPKAGESGFDVPASRKTDKTCFECHSDMKDDIDKAKFVHGPVSSGDCLLCHNPHSSDFRGQTIMKTNQLCLSCHEKKYGKDHPVMMHPVQGVRDMNSPKNELSCISCHSPHFGANEKLFYKATGVFQLCQECHKK